MTENALQEVRTMTKNRFIQLQGLLWCFFMVYFAVILKGSDFWGHILSPLGAAFASSILFYTAHKTKRLKISWNLLGLACSSWAIADILGAVYALVFGIDSETVDMFMYLYLLPNLFIAAAAAMYFYSQKHLWNTLQLILDVLVTVSVAVTIIFVIFLDHHFESLMSLDTDSITVFLYILSDFFALGILFVVYVSTQSPKMSNTLRSFILGIALYTAADLYYSYQIFHDSYVTNSIVDTAFIASLFILAGSGLLEIHKPTEEAVSTQNIVLGTGRRHHKKALLLLFSILFIFATRGFLLRESLFIIVIIACHQVLSGYVQNNIYREYLYNKEKSANDLLEQRILERSEELMRLNKKLELIAKEDYITGLLNRRYFLEGLDKLILEKQGVESVTLLYMDLDRFKAINDFYGHDIGDLVLIEIANRLNKWKPSAILLARIGGDEFTVALKGSYEEQKIEKVAKEIIELCYIPIHINSYQFNISISIGIASYPKDAADRGSLMKNADIAMYQAKQSGSNQYVFYNSHISERARRKHELEILLKSVDYDREFELFYQPQFKIPEGEIKGVEALIRWRNPQRGMIYPGEFIPIAEETGIIMEIGDWVLNQAISQIAKWNRSYNLDLVMSVNISPREFDNPNFTHKLRKVIQRHDCRPEWIDIEITEGIAMKSEVALIDMFEELASIGVTISIDDFGTGYSSLSTIKRFDIDRLKIAKPLIDSISTSYNDEQIVKTIIIMAKTMGLQTIAEGVELDEQLEKLIELGCDEVQGYIYSRPIPALEFENKYLQNFLEIVK